MKLRKLVIISHTEHFKSGGEIVGFGPTVNEINSIAKYFDEIVHIGCLYPNEVPKNTASYISERIRFEAIPPFGGRGLLAKIWACEFWEILLLRSSDCCRNQNQKDRVK